MATKAEPRVPSVASDPDHADLLESVDQALSAPTPARPAPASGTAPGNDRLSAARRYQVGPGGSAPKFDRGAAVTPPARRVPRVPPPGAVLTDTMSVGAIEPWTKHARATSSIGLLLKLACAAAAIALVAMAAWTYAPGEDAHYVAARKMVDAYELVRQPKMRNYDNPVYASALQELEQVDPRSGSARDAAALEAEIRSRTEEFRRRQAAWASQLETARTKIDRRDTDTQRSIQYYIAHPRTEFPDCEEGPSDSH